MVSVESSATIKRTRSRYSERRREVMTRRVCTLLIIPIPRTAPVEYTYNIYLARCRGGE